MFQKLLKEYALANLPMLLRLVASAFAEKDADATGVDDEIAAAANHLADRLEKYPTLLAGK
jgi:hypothetical protein